MKTSRILKIAVASALVALILPVAQMWAADMKPEKTEMPTMTLAQLHAKQLPLIRQTLENVRKAVEAGQKEQALAELKKVKDLLTMTDQILAQNIQPAFVNTVCPIMGSKIDPAQVTPALTREFNGQKVAFCCAMCPPAWDKLTDTQKQAKLSAAQAAAEKEHQH